jgi:hypothetical protein
LPGEVGIIVPEGDVPESLVVIGSEPLSNVLNVPESFERGISQNRVL